MQPQHSKAKRVVVRHEQVAKQCVGGGLVWRRGTPAIQTRGERQAEQATAQIVRQMSGEMPVLTLQSSVTKSPAVARVLG